MEIKTLISHTKSCQKVRESTLLINNCLFGYSRENIKNSWAVLIIFCFLGEEFLE